MFLSSLEKRQGTSQRPRPVKIIFAPLNELKVAQSYTYLMHFANPLW